LICKAPGAPLASARRNGSNPLGKWNEKRYHLDQQETTLMKALLLAMSLSAPAWAADPEFTIQLREHRFTPSELKVPAGVKVKLVIDNQDATPEEFDSFALNREKIVFANSKGIVFIGPLKPGRYEFIGEFNRNTASGVVIAE
jgi:hypothetical protein